MKHLAKLVTTVLLGVTAVFSQRVWDGTADVSWYSFNDADSVFTISTPEHLAGLALLVNEGNNFSGKTIELGADIYLNNVSGNTSANFDPAGKRAWTRIGVSGRPFNGSFDGKNRSIYGLYIPEGDTVGLFGNIGAGAYQKPNSISNLNLRTGRVTGTRDVGGLAGILGADTVSNVSSDIIVNGVDRVDIYGVEVISRHVGGLAGSMSNNSNRHISNCHMTGDVTGSGDYVGGLAGTFSGTITNSYMQGEVTGSGSHVGGLAGSFSGTIINSYMQENVTGSAYVGGLAGQSSGSIVSSYAIGIVTGSGNYIGGLVGSSSSTVANSYATGDVTGSSNSDNVGGLAGHSTGIIFNSHAIGNATGDQYVGGLVGFASATNSGKSVVNSYAIGNVRGVSNIGGLVGYFSSSEDRGIDYCYSVGRVTRVSGTSSDVGGLIGRHTSTPHRVASSYWNTATSGQTVSAGGTGKTTSEMMSRATYTDWDFTNVWQISEGSGYPTLRGNIAVTNITGVPTTSPSKWPLVLSVTIVPAYASNTAITWSVVSAGTTSATFSRDTLKTTAAGMVTIRATIVNGKGVENYTQDFTITMNIVTNTVTVGPGWEMMFPNMTGSGTYNVGDVVAISAGEIAETYADIGYKFSHWTALNHQNVLIADSTSPTTTFIMPPNAVNIYPQWVYGDVSVLTPDRVIPQSPSLEDASVVAPVNTISAEFTAGPNPIAKSTGSVDFFFQGKLLNNGMLTIYDASGNVIRKITIHDNAIINNQARRHIGSWDLTDRNGRRVGDGTYLVRGSVKTVDGKRKRVSVLVGVH